MYGRAVFHAFKPKCFDGIFILDFDNDEFLEFGYKTNQNQFYIDRSKIGELGLNQEFGTRQISNRISNCEDIKIRAIIDKCSIELFIDDGLQCFTEIFFASSNEFKIKIFGQSDIKIWAI